MWLYLAEIMTPKGAGIAYGFNWIGVIIFSLGSLFLFEKVNRSLVYLLFASFCSLGILFILLCIRETKGLSPYRCKKLYYPKGFKTLEPISSSERFYKMINYTREIELDTKDKVSKSLIVKDVDDIDSPLLE